MNQKNVEYIALYFLVIGVILVIGMLGTVVKRIKLYNELIANVI